MKKIDMISRIVLTIMTFIIFSIMIINEDSSWNIVPVIFSLIVFGFSFLSSKIARKIIDIGNKINNKILRFLYYIVLPIVLLGISLLICVGLSNWGEKAITSDDFSTALGQAIMVLFAMTVIAIAIVLPYIQAIIILILNKIVKEA